MGKILKSAEEVGVCCEISLRAKPIRYDSEHRAVVGLSCLIQFGPLHRFMNGE